MFSRVVTIALIILSSFLFVSGCSSDSPNPIAPEQQVIVDTAPPIVPTNLNASPFRWWVKVAWDENTVDSDIQGFNVYRLVFGGTFLITETPLQDCFYIDRTPLSVDCVYAVTAIDVNGNESAWAQFSYSNIQVDQPEREDSPTGN